MNALESACFAFFAGVGGAKPKEIESALYLSDWDEALWEHEIRTTPWKPGSGNEPESDPYRARGLDDAQGFALGVRR